MSETSTYLRSHPDQHFQTEWEMQTSSEQKLNKFCQFSVLKNESSVEQFFVIRLLEDLGYKDTSIKTKETLDKIAVGKGSKSENYRPDYALMIKNKPNIIIDAKDPNEKLDSYIYQVSGYSLGVNQRYEGENPVQFFVLTNGRTTQLYRWDETTKPLIELKFEDFNDDSPKYQKLCPYISFKNISSKSKKTEKHNSVIIKKIDKEDAQKIFSSCHNHIWKADKVSPEWAFMEFTKIICIKLYHDKVIHEKYPEFSKKDVLEYPIKNSDITFSTSWIESREVDTTNPLSDLKYKEMLKNIEYDILHNNKKRMFSTDDKIDLKASTIKSIVKKLEKYDLHGIDEDLNGRLFETFLNATMRGKDLGQYFTPRSIVKLAVKLADLTASEKHIDIVLDGCCGTGGFLIEAFAEMKNKIEKNSSYSVEKKKTLIQQIAYESIFGIDAAKKPMLAKIARINMYLHDDGGSHIYFADGLDKNLSIEKTESNENKKDMEDLTKNIEAINGFDVILTNPPFSMEYSLKEESESKILKQYDLSKFNYFEDKIEERKTRNNLKSGILFIERYYDLLKPNGKLITVMDEALLSSPVFEFFRHFIRRHFIIHAVISLHGDAFHMSSSRVKTSLVYLIKKNHIEDEQSSVFMYSSIKLGVDDLPVTTSKDKVKVAREQAEIEINQIVSEFKRYENGEKDSWLVDSEKIKDRMDVKYCIDLKGRFVKKWKEEGYNVKRIHELVDIREDCIRPKNHPDTKFDILELTYSGKCNFAGKRVGKYIGNPKIQKVKKNDLIISCYNSFNGAIGVVTEEFDGHYVTDAYIVLEPENIEIGIYLWSILRTTEIKSEFLAYATGTGRQTVAWEGKRSIKKIQIPMLAKKEITNITSSIISSWIKQKEIKDNFQKISNVYDSSFNVESKLSKIRFESAKPPR